MYLSLLFILIATGITLSRISSIKASEEEKKFSIEVGDVTEETFYKIPIKLTLPASKNGEVVLHSEGIHLLDSEILEDISSKYPEEKVKITLDEKDNATIFSYKKDTSDLVLEFNVSLLEEAESLKLTLLSANNVLAEIEKNYAELKKKVKANEKKLADIPSIGDRSLIRSVASNPVNVNNWSSFVQAMHNPNYDEINLTADLTANSSFGTAMTRSVVINGNGHTINIGNTNSYPIELGTVADEQTISLVNINLTGTNNSIRQAFVKTAANGGANWNIIFENINLPEGNRTSLAYAPNALVKITGTSSFYNTGAALRREFIIAHKLYITDRAKLSGSFKSDFYNSALANSEVIIDKASQIQFSSSARFFSLSGANSEIKVYGDTSMATRTGNTNLQLESTSTETADSGGLFNFNTGRYGPPVHFSVSDYATVTAHSQSPSNSTPVVMIEATNTQFNVANNSYMEMISNGQSTTHGATMRFRYSGNSSFNLSGNSTMKITKTQGSQAAIRMNGGGNAVNVSSGSKFFVAAHGSGRPSNPSATGGTDASAFQNNQAIVFLNELATSPADSFTLSGKNSVVKLDAKLGPAIDAARDVDVVVGKDSFFETIGNTGGRAIFYSGSGKVNFQMNEPMFYDFRNNAETTGGDLLSANSSNSMFESINSDVSFWKKGSNLNGSPYYDRSLVTYKLLGTNLGLSVSPDNDFTMKFGNMGSSINQYSRIAANNSSPIVDDLRIPTNSDKFIYGHISVAEGFDDNGNRIIRDSWDNEAQVKVKLEFPNGTSKIIQGTTYEGPSTIYESTNQKGYFKIPLDDFIPAGTKVSIEEAWRGPANATEQHKHTSGAEDIKVPVVETIDVTPPTQAVVSTEINNATKQLSGTSDENGSKVFIKVNGQWLKGSNGQAVTTVVSNEKWTLNLPKYVTKSDKVDVYLKDTTSISPLPAYVLPDTYTQEPDDVFGNMNVDVDKYGTYSGYHDAIKNGAKDDRFHQAKRLIVKDVLPDQPTLVKTAISSGGETTSVGDTVTYTLKASNPKADSQDWKNVRLVDQLAEGLEFDPSNHGITINGEPIQDSKFEYEESTRTLTILAGDIAAKKNITATFNVKIGRGVVGEKIKNKASALGDSPQETPFVPGPTNPNSGHVPISVDSQEVPLPGDIIHGIIELSSFPTEIDFGKQRATGNTTRVETPEYSEELIVSDNRGTLKEWILTVKVDTPMTSQLKENVKLPRAIRFSKNGDERVLDGNAYEIFTHKNDKQGDVNITETWKKNGQGFKLEVPPNQIGSLGVYKAILVWELADAPLPTP
ncbi:fimbrial isopeptide formation D2 domain-containing protein [Enterococcus caccae]|nr:fimbrial isopeptide formation D2 domain-containing protein [Enterococcus caccae]